MRWLLIKRSIIVAVGAALMAVMLIWRRGTRILADKARKAPIPAPDRPAGLILPRDRAVPPASRAFIACLRAYVSEVA